LIYVFLRIFDEGRIGWAFDSNPGEEGTAEPDRPKTSMSAKRKVRDLYSVVFIMICSVDPFVVQLYFPHISPERNT
jgi:hypothetical protein